MPQKQEHSEPNHILPARHVHRPARARMYQTHVDCNSQRCRQQLEPRAHSTCHHTTHTYLDVSFHPYGVPGRVRGHDADRREGTGGVGPEPRHHLHLQLRHPQALDLSLFCFVSGGVVRCGAVRRTSVAAAKKTEKKRTKKKKRCAFSMPRSGAKRGQKREKIAEGRASLLLCTIGRPG